VKRLLVISAPLLAAFWLASAQGAEKGKPAKSGETCNGDFGTSVQFEKNKDEAARKALKEEKLVCVLHISGYFEDPDFT
jgi:hypothetical protein